MRFRLIYEGLLESNGGAAQKHSIRKAFHPQLRKLWQVSPNLTRQAVTYGARDGNPTRVIPWPEYSVMKGFFNRVGYDFVPLAKTSQDVLVSLNILFLRHGLPGSVLRRADIDNRLKTLFDGLRMPGNVEELGGHLIPAADETPFFVLLEDDSQITQISVETDALLSLIPGQIRERRNDARLVITVDIQPVVRTPENQYF